MDVFEYEVQDDETVTIDGDEVNYLSYIIYHKKVYTYIHRIWGTHHTHTLLIAGYSWHKLQWQVSV